MVKTIQQNAQNRMQKSIEALHNAFNKIRTGRAHPSLLEAIRVDYYGNEVPLMQVANVNVEDARTLAVIPWEKTMVTKIEKAILTSDLGLNPATSGQTIRVPMPPLTEETRRNYTRQARSEAEQARIAIRNLRRDANNEFKVLLKDKQISEDELRQGEEAIQKLTDQFIAEIEQLLQQKEHDLMQV